MNSFKEKIDFLIQNGNTLDALENLCNFYKDKDKDIYNRLLLLNSTYKEIRSNKNVGMLKEEDYRIEKVKINSAILEINSLFLEKNEAIVRITNLPDRDWLFFSVSADYISEIINLMDDENRRPYLNLILGMAGIGKTYLARKVALEYSIKKYGKFNIIWFVNSESIESIISDLSDLGKHFSILYEGDIDIFLKKIKDTLTKTESTWLLIFDNACDRTNDNYNPKFFADRFFPRTEFPKQILVTSQNLDWFYVFNPKKHIQLNMWTEDDCKNFLAQYKIPIINTSELRTLYYEFAGLPVAIAQAVGYIRRKKISIDKYLKILRENKIRLLNINDITVDYKNSILNVILLTYYSLSEKSQIFLTLLSFLYPDNIPLDLFLEKLALTTNKYYYISNNPFFDNLELEEAKSELLIYFLAEQANINIELISIHRLVKFGVQLSSKNNEDYIIFLKEILCITNATFDIDIKKIDVEEFQHFDILLPHILSVMANCSDFLNEMGDEIINLSILSLKLGKYFVRLGNNHDAFVKLKEAEDFINFQPEYYDELIDSRIKLQLGHLYYLSDGKDAGNVSLQMFKDAFLILKKYNFPQEIARCVNNIGNIYLMRQDYENAADWYRKGLEISKESFLYHNLGYIYQSYGLYDKAIKQYNKSLFISKADKNSHRIGVNLYLLGIIYGLKSDFEKQEKYHAECLSLYREMQQSRRISYCLFQIINFSLDTNKIDAIYEMYDEHRKYFEYISEDSLFILNSLVLKLRFAIFELDTQNIMSTTKELTTKRDMLLSYPTDSHAVSAYLDLARWYYQNNKLQEAKYAAQEAFGYRGMWQYHREKELINLINLIKLDDEGFNGYFQEK
jgi:tetratricopeptide (TPR) repeat protein